MRLTFFLRTSAISAVLISVSGGAHANDTVLWPKKPYSADMSVMADGQTISGKFYLDGPNMRVELDTPQGPTIQIIDRDTGDALMLMQSNGQKIAMKINAADATSQMRILGRDALPKPIGTKRIDWKKCKVYQIEADKICVTNDLIALEAINDRANSVTTFTNVKIGKQKTSIFAVPDGYQVMDMSGFGGLMGGVGRDTFGSSESILGTSMDSAIASGEKIDDAGEISGNIPPDFMDSIMSIATADDAAAGDAALDKLLGGSGVPKDMATRDTTTTDVLIEGLDGMMFKNDTEREQAAAMNKENRRLAKIMEDEGMAGFLRESGVDEADIAMMENSQSDMAEKLEAHAQKHSAAVAESSNFKVDEAQMSDAIDLQKELDAIGARVDALAADGSVTEADKAQLQREAEQTLEKVLGNLSAK